MNRGFATCLFLLGITVGSAAQELPYFVTYSHDLEEPGNLEVSFKSAQGSAKYGNPFISETVEFEYGAKGWWTSEAYLSGQHTSNDSTVFTGLRWENRFRPLMREHLINPVFYVEYESLRRSDRSLLEVTGHDSVSDFLLTNAQAGSETEQALELKLILSSNLRGWNVSENFIAEKDLNESEPWEFGYALGAARPLGLAASRRPCILCRENFSAGAELYGGLGDLDGFGLKATSHYAGPTVGFNIPHGPTITFSPNFGLNGNSAGVIFRFSVAYEFEQIFGHFLGGDR